MHFKVSTTFDTVSSTNSSKKNIGRTSFPIIKKSSTVKKVMKLDIRKMRSTYCKETSYKTLTCLVLNVVSSEFWKS